MRLIGFCGPAGAGKSTAALHLVEHYGFERVRFAGPLKAMMAALGLSEREIEGDLKEQPCELLCGRSPRYAMQTIGTEWGREIIGSDLWTRAWSAAVDRAFAAGRSVVVDDCRFPNEAAAIRARSGTLIRIERPAVLTVASAHVSEMHELPADIVVANCNSVPDLFGEIERLAA